MNCPKCDRIVDPQAIKCPYCNNPLKGFGHPGIPLYQAETYAIAAIIIKTIVAIILNALMLKVALCSTILIHP